MVVTVKKDIIFPLCFYFRGNKVTPNTLTVKFKK